ncbi:hypothetical protein [Bacillus sp. AFS031507]|uniref:hypothetical protein n=1 Tax=Bacillus sp. AFS031507 TaxID=2033496 RepID=UPI000BFD1779|nr:hypothetical protein [Bacillus sp. AFS031507]PGY10625.1 hypothetical protein COE25_12690 [Bacillus sp. AFS031507]
MNVIKIEIHYYANSKALQQGSFPLRGKKPEVIALEWWKQIKKNMSQHAELEKVVVNGDQDITELVMELEDKEVKRIMDDNLPF